MRPAAGPFAVGASLFGLSLLLLWRGGGDGDTAELRRYGDAVLAGQVPYRDFRLEYPPGAIPFFTVPSLAEYLAVSERTVYDLLKGEIASYKLGGARRIHPSDVDLWLEQRREGGTDG